MIIVVVIVTFVIVVVVTATGSDGQRVHGGQHIGLVEEEILEAGVDDQRIQRGFVVVRVVLVVLEPVLHDDFADVRVAFADDEHVDRHAWYSGNARVRRELVVERHRVSRVVGNDAAFPCEAGIAAGCRRDPGILVAQDVYGAVVIEEADDAVAVARAHGTGGLVLLLESLVADIGRIAGRADDGHVGPRVARVKLRGRAHRAEQQKYECRARHGAHNDVNRLHDTPLVIVIGCGSDFLIAHLD